MGRRNSVKACPKCGAPGSGPYLKRAGNRPLGFYFKHANTKGETTKPRWHYIPSSDTPESRRERMIWDMAKQGYMGIRYYARLLGVSDRTTSRYVCQLRADRKLIHRPYGGYIPDPTGKKFLSDPGWLWWLWWQDGWDGPQSQGPTRRGNHHHE